MWRMSVNTQLIRDLLKQALAAIRYNDDLHEYIHVPTSTKMTGVTSLIKKYTSVFDPDATIERMMEKPEWGDGKYKDMTPEEIKHQWKTNGDLKSKMGTKMHHLIELEMTMGNQDWPVDLIRERDSFRLFYKDIVSKGWNLFQCEGLIYDTNNMVAGRYDCLMQKGDSFLLLDWKRNEKIEARNFGRFFKVPLNTVPESKHMIYTMQLNLYKYILKRVYGINVVGTAVICLYEGKFNVVPIEDRESDILTMLRHHRSTVGLMEPMYTYSIATPIYVRETEEDRAIKMSLEKQ